MVDSATHENEPDRQLGFERVQKARYRPARLTGLLLILQAVGLAAFVALELLDLSLLAQNGKVTANLQQTTNDVISLFFIPTIVLAFLAALSLVILARRGWLLAAISQGLCLAVCLWIYSGEGTPAYVYPVMVSSIVMIFYLNSRTVRSLFHSGQTAIGRGRRG